MHCKQFASVAHLLLIPSVFFWHHDMFGIVVGVVVVVVALLGLDICGRRPSFVLCLSAQKHGIASALDVEADAL